MDRIHGGRVETICRWTLPPVCKFPMQTQCRAQPAGVYVVQNTVVPGGSFGWHNHPGPTLVMVVSGTATEYHGDDPTCTPILHPAGSTFIDSGEASGHPVRNDGSVNLVVVAARLFPEGPYHALICRIRLFPNSELRTAEQGLVHLFSTNGEWLNSCASPPPPSSLNIRLTDSNPVGHERRELEREQLVGSWSALGAGMNGVVYALAVTQSGAELYAGGEFTSAGGNSLGTIMALSYRLA